MDNAWLKRCLKCPPPACTQADKRRRHWRIAAVTSHWAHHCQLSKKNIYPPACLVHCDGACQKLRNQMQNYLKYTNKTSGTFFRGNVILSTKVLQGSVTTHVNHGRIFIDFFTANLPQSVVIKEFWKSVSISQSYRQKYSGTFFPDTV